MRLIITENQISKNKLLELIEKFGLIQTARLIGGYKLLLNLIDEDEISFLTKIKTINSYISEEGGISLTEFSQHPIFYELLNGELHQIEYLALNYVVVQVLGGEKHQYDMGEYNVLYVNLSDKILDEILEIICS